MGPPSPPLSFPKRGSKGSRRAIFSCTATGVRTGLVAEDGTSAFAAVTGFETVFAFEAGGALDTGLTAAAAGALTALAGTRAAFEPGVVPGPGLPTGAVAGLAVALDAACAEDEVCAVPAAGLAAGLAADGDDAAAGFTGAAGLVVCACFGAAGAAALDVAGAGDEVCAVPAAGLAADGEDVVAAPASVAGLVFCTCFGAAGAVEAGPL
jgi:hypothetical protein